MNISKIEYLFNAETFSARRLKSTAWDARCFICICGRHLQWRLEAEFHPWRLIFVIYLQGRNYASRRHWRCLPHLEAKHLASQAFDHSFNTSIYNKWYLVFNTNNKVYLFYGETSFRRLYWDRWPDITDVSCSSVGDVFSDALKQISDLGYWFS